MISKLSFAIQELSPWFHKNKTLTGMILIALHACQCGIMGIVSITIGKIQGPK